MSHQSPSDEEGDGVKAERITQQLVSLLLNTNTIINISPEQDKNISLSSVLQLYPSAVLIHKKD